MPSLNTLRLKVIDTFTPTGRTGRAGREGKAVTYFTDEDAPFLKTYVVLTDSLTKYTETASNLASRTSYFSRAQPYRNGS